MQTALTLHKVPSAFGKDSDPMTFGWHFSTPLPLMRPHGWLIIDSIETLLFSHIL